MSQPKPHRGQYEVFPRFISLLDERRAQGFNSYGVYLETFNGRDPLWDLWAELVDGAQYLVQRKMQDEEIKRVLLKACDTAAERKWSQTVNLIGYALELFDGKAPFNLKATPDDVGPP